MDNSLKIFNSESNLKTETKRDKISTDNDVKVANDEPFFYKIF